ncbi:hypothetical protein NEOLEDRAFT_1057778 [Neolentinus lepideus HHB14362 ss-1]|uniref:Uncharacterized protein n=1 Tax=Neolentinus lepideus HHB14362 ss-1 TaxID=1314782 RepID=A0A165UVD4_9AGAM|nr:hypothetical protein NEOLEDRAFT_1057778 [Neolentinus lepideus HHB14362 ss-1]
MKFTTIIVPAAAILIASVTSVPVRRDVDPSLVPQFGWEANVNPTGELSTNFGLGIPVDAFEGTGDCDGAVLGSNGQPIKVPCACPPDRDSFIQSLNANVNAGHAVNNPSVAVSFPTDGSQQSQSARIETALVTLQNLHGPGQGCPAASTTFVAQQNAIAAGGNPSTVVAAASSIDAAALATAAAAPASTPAAAPAPAPAPAAPSAAPAAASGGAVNVASLAPPLGFQSGVNPTGTGDCDGAVNGADGKPIKVPCACPPSQDEYIQQLQANVNAGHAVNNPSVAVSFPTDSSPASQAARIEAALVTIQNLNGPGQGCPAASTTLSVRRVISHDSVCLANSNTGSTQGSSSPTMSDTTVLLIPLASFSIVFLQMFSQFRV